MIQWVRESSERRKDPSQLWAPSDGLYERKSRGPQTRGSVVNPGQAMRMFCPPSKYACRVGGVDAIEYEISGPLTTNNQALARAANALRKNS